MKFDKLLFILPIFCFWGGFISCSVDKSIIGDDIEIPELTDENTIQFTVDATIGAWKRIEIYADGGKMAIDWGDGRLQKIEEPGTEVIIYKYGNSKTYRVRIWAENLVTCRVSGLLLSLKDLHLGYLPKMKILDMNSFVATTELDLSSSCPNVEDINIGNYSDLEHLDISRCSKLKSIQVYTNPKLTSLRFGNHPELTSLNCFSNDLTFLSLKGLEELREVNCSYNPNLSTIETDDNMAVNILQCNHCNFKSMDFLYQMPVLRDLICYCNELVELDLSGLFSLTYLNCHANKLTRLYISSSNNIQWLECYSNRLDKDALNNLFEVLPDVTSYTPLWRFKICFYDNPGENTCNKNLLLQKGWAVKEKLL